MNKAVAIFTKCLTTLYLHGCGCHWWSLGTSRSVRLRLCILISSSTNRRLSSETPTETTAEDNTKNAEKWGRGCLLLPSDIFQPNLVIECTFYRLTGVQNLTRCWNIGIYKTLKQFRMAYSMEVLRDICGCSIIYTIVSRSPDMKWLLNTSYRGGSRGFVGFKRTPIRDKEIF